MFSCHDYQCPAHPQFEKRLDERFDKAWCDQKKCNAELFRRIGLVENEQSAQRGASDSNRFILKVLSIVLGGGIVAEIIRLLLTTPVGKVHS
jgi:SPX domain protein involved in polyphosphate accumulation